MLSNVMLVNHLQKSAIENKLVNSSALANVQSDISALMNELVKRLEKSEQEAASELKTIRDALSNQTTTSKLLL